ncbi:hypothetical protein CRM90_23955 [Mycobacterium sp. ENV421]|nr:hypothetical protein CRM90_23955 [Mycobacterium sp. ENV421]
MVTLSARVANFGVRWHQRAVVRRWPDAGKAAFEIAISGNSVGPDGVNSALAIELDVATVDGKHQVGMRGAVKIDDEHLLALVDAEIRVSIDREPPTDDELIDLARGWGHDYLMGYLGVGLSDSAAQVGILNVGLPPSYVLQPSHESAAELVAAARSRAAAKADAESR